jgi:hypothetical protein
MKTTDEMTAKQIIALIERLSDQLNAIHDDCENISASMEMLREADDSKSLEAAEKWADTAVGITLDLVRALNKSKQFLRDG